MPADPVAIPMDTLEEGAPAQAVAVADAYEFAFNGLRVYHVGERRTLLIWVTATNGNEAVDPSPSATVDIAIIPITQARPADGDWMPASWHKWEVSAGLIDLSVDVVVQPGVVGELDIWIRVTDVDLIPIEYIGRIEVR